MEMPIPEWRLVVMIHQCHQTDLQDFHLIPQFVHLHIACVDLCKLKCKLYAVGYTLDARGIQYMYID